MALGSVLIQPQRIRRAAAVTDPSKALVEDVLNLFVRVMADKAQGGRIADVMNEAMEAVAARLVVRSTTGLTNARHRLQRLLAPLVQGVQGAGQRLATAEEEAHLVQEILGILAELADTAGRLSIDQLRGPLREMLNIIETDLGFTPDFIEQQVWALIDDLISRLRQIPPETDTDLRNNRLAVISVLRRVRRQMKEVFSFPRLSADHLAGGFLAWLRSSGIGAVLQKAACVGQGVSEGAQAAGILLQWVPYTGFGTRSVGAAGAASSQDRQYCWYATWLLGNKETAALTEGRIEPPALHKQLLAAFVPLPFFFLVSKEDITFDTRKKKVMKDDKAIDEGIDGWSQLSVFTRLTGDHYTFKHFRPETMEKWAFGTAVAGNILEMILHLVSLEEGDYASNSVNAANNAVFMLYNKLKKEPMHGGVEWGLLRVLLTLLASLEGRHTRVSDLNWFMMWLTLVGPDMAEMVMYNGMAGTVRDFILSLMTLLNYDGPVRHEPFPDETPDNRPLNRREIDGVADLLVAGFTKLLVMSVPREDYAHPGQDPGEHVAKMWLLWELLGGIGFGLMGGFVGTVVAETVAWAEDWSVLGRKLLVAMAQTCSPVSFWPALYMDKEGNTDGGRYNPNGAPFNGYPPAASSPYSLPYVAGLSIYVGQGNQGMWSHNFINGSQVYAYDFSMDQDEEVLASRPGTVVSFFERTPDDTTGTWNNIYIRHDVDDNGNPITPDPNHDLDAGGRPVVTFAVYGHGRQNSVTAVFAQRTPPVLTANIVGTRVRRGQPIMRAGDTGISFHNHLHMQVHTELLPRPGGAGAPVTSAVQNTNYTIPFVFREVTNFLGTDGVPKYFNFYTSRNTRIP